jgi:TPP-dependent pyruvate/acetoin dehydrogenase alpha subunit
MTASTAPQPASPHLAPVAAPFSLIPPNRLWEIYAAMLRCRAIAQRAAQLVESGVPAHTLRDALDREATYAGILVGLQSSDVLLPAPEDRLAGFLHGLSLADLFAPFAPGPWRRRRSTSKSIAQPLAPTPGAQLHLANGAAFALKPQVKDPLVVALCGPGLAPDPAWQQALDFAAAHTLPIVFVCHADARDAGTLAKAEACFNQLFSLAQAARVPAIAVDGQDAVAVYRVASESISRARLRRGPTLIACLAHSTSHLPSSSPPAGSPADPGEAIRGMETYLVRKALFDPGRKAQLLDAFARHLDRATRRLLR